MSANIPNDPTAIQRFFTSRDNNANSATYVGQEQRLWYDPITNAIYVSDGNTAGGILVGTGGGGNGVPGGPTNSIQYNAGGGNFGGTANLVISGDGISVVGNVTTTTFFIGNGSQLTDLPVQPGTYGNSNVATFLGNFGSNTVSTTGSIISGNIIPALDNTYFLGNSTNRWANLWLGPGTLYITDSNISSNVTAALTVTNGVLLINNVVQLQAPGIANGNANIAIANSGNVTITTLPGSTPLQWIFDDTGNLRCASVTEQDNLIGENNGDFFITGSQSVKLNAGLSGNVSLTVNESNITVTGDIFTTGNTIIENDTNATDAASGSLQTLGGAAIAQDLYVGSNIYSNGVTVGGNVLVQDGNQNNIIELQTDGNIVFNGGSTLNLNGGFYVSSVSPNSGDANIVNYVGGAFVYGPALKDYAGNIGADNVTLTGILKAPQTTKASTATGTTGQICWDANYIYVCTATNTWKRSPLTGGY